jgi:hypothetical protein
LLLLSTILEEGSLISDLEELRFDKKDLDQIASREASVDISRWISINGEGLHPESIYQDGWLQEIWEESDLEVDEVDDHNAHELFGTSELQIESWLNQIS